MDVCELCFTPMPLGRRREPFDHPGWIFELKYDGFRALLSIGVEHNHGGMLWRRTRESNDRAS
jgi:hypothetical protein